MAGNNVVSEVLVLCFPKCGVRRCFEQSSATEYAGTPD